MFTVIEISNPNDLSNIRSDVYIPQGSNVDVTIEVSGWFLIAQGTTLSTLASVQGWDTGLANSGLEVQSRETSIFSTTIVFHCLAIRDVYLSNIDISGREVAYAGIGGQIFNWAILGVLLLLGITAGVTLIRISADNTRQVTTKTDLTQQLIDKGYTQEQINEILRNLQPKSPTTDIATIAKWVAISAGIIAVIYLGSKAAPTIQKIKKVRRLA